jgi:hypothetical protein
MPEQTWYAALSLAVCVELDWAMDKHAVGERSRQQAAGAMPTGQHAGSG